MSLEDVKARIQTTMKTVSGIGKVYTEHPNPKDDAQIQQQMMSGGRIHVWIIERELSTATDIVVNQNLVEKVDQLLIEGYFSFAYGDGSAKRFNDLVDAIIAAINVDRRAPGELNKLVSTATPPNYKFGLAMYGGSQVLCRKAEIRMRVTGYLQ